MRFVRLLDLMFARDPVTTLERALLDFSPQAVGLSVRNLDNTTMQSPESFVVQPVCLGAHAEVDAPVAIGEAESRRNVLTQRASREFAGTEGDALDVPVRDLQISLHVRQLFLPRNRDHAGDFALHARPTERLQ